MRLLSSSWMLHSVTLQVIAHGRIVAAAHRFVDRHYREIAVHVLLGNVDHALGRMHADWSSRRRELVARISPSFVAQSCRHGIAIEYREHEIIDGPPVSARLLGSSMRSQHAFDHLADHSQAERIGAPARSLGGLNEFRLTKKDLGVMPGARAGIIVDALLDEESGMLIDEVRERLSSRIGGRRSEKPDRTVPSVLASTISISPPLHFAKAFSTKNVYLQDLGIVQFDRMSYTACAMTDVSFFYRFRPGSETGWQQRQEGGAASDRFIASLALNAFERCSALQGG